MRIAVLGGDGYCGWATALYLSKQGHSVAIIDNFIRRQWDFELGVQTLTPIQPLPDRLRAWHEHTGKKIDLLIGDVTDYEFLAESLNEFKPEAVVHFAEQRSAPYSMIDRRHAVVHTGEQCGRHAQPALRAPRIPSRLPSCEARHDG